MQLLFSDRYYDTPKYEKGKYKNELAKELTNLDPNVKTFDTDIGHGADWPVVLVELFKDSDWSTFFTVAGSGGLLLAGDKINDSIEGWIEIAKKLKKIINKIRPARIDEFAATTLVLDELSEKIDNNVKSISIQTEEFREAARNDRKLSRRYDSLYIITIRIGDKVMVKGIKSTGEKVFEHDFSYTTGPNFKKREKSLISYQKGNSKPLRQLRTPLRIKI